MLNIYVNGLSGKMGSSILNQVSKIEDILIIESIANCDVVIDFSRPESSLKILNKCLENKIPPTINTENPDSDIVHDFDIVFNDVREKTVHYAMSNTFGFGGHIATVLVKKFEE